MKRDQIYRQSLLPYEASTALSIQHIGRRCAGLEHVEMHTQPSGSIFPELSYLYPEFTLTAGLGMSAQSSLLAGWTKRPVWRLTRLDLEM